MTLYTWDQRHRLTRVSVTTAVNGTPVTRTVDYSYDVSDRLIGRTESATNAQSFSEGRLFDGDTLIAEYNPSTGSVTNRYISGDTIDQVFVQINHATSSTSERYALTDGLGSVEAIQTVGQQSLDLVYASFVDRPVFADYDSYGNTVWKNAEVRPREGEVNSTQPGDWTGNDSLFSWTGRELDPVGGLQWNRAR